MEESGEIEDCHTCKRCHMDIIGLENYVTHRQQNCQPSKTFHTSQTACLPANEIGYNNDMDLQNATDFFSSLELKCNVSETFNVSNKKLSTDLFPMTFEYDSDNYVEGENSYYPPQTHTGGKWEPGTRPDLTNEQCWLRSPSPTRTQNECNTATVKATNNKEYFKFPCKMCPAGFNSEIKYLHHLLVNHKNNANKQWEKIILHHQTKANRLLPFQCVICQFYFKENDDLHEHLKSGDHRKQLTDVKRSLYCLTCKYEADKNDDLITHVASEIHSETIKNYLNYPEFHPVMITEKTLRFSCNFCTTYCKLELKTVAANIANKIVIYNCPYCDFNSKLSSLLKCHICKTHPGNGRRILEQKTSVSEVKEKLKPEDLTCKVCSETWKNMSEMRQHVISKHPEKSINCETCNRLFMSEHDYTIHLDSKLHKNRLKEVLTQMAANQYKKALAQIAANRSKEAGTQIAGEVNSSKEALNEINYDLEPELTQQQTFECHKCLFKSESRGLMSLHYTQHEGPIPYVRYDRIEQKIIGNVYQCPFCSKEFRYSQLESHIYTHTGEKPFKCNLCHKAFAQKSTLKQHETTVHLENVIFDCQLCHFQTKREAIFKIHTETHHSTKTTICQENNRDVEDSETTRAEKKFLCEICAYSTRTKSNLTIHRRIHTNEKPFNCKICDFKCAHYGNLVRHSRIHAKGHDFKCPYCVYTCSVQEEVRKHIAVTKIHPTLPVFPCSFPDCNYASDIYQNFRTHVMEEHLDVYLVGRSDAEVLPFLYPRKDLTEPVITSKRVQQLKIPTPVIENAKASSQTSIPRVAAKSVSTLSRISQPTFQMTSIMSPSIPIQMTSSTSSMPIQVTSTTTSPMPIQVTSTTTAPLPSSMPILIAPNTSSSMPILIAPNTSSSMPILIAPNTSSSMPILIAPNTSSSMPILIASNTSSSMPILIASNTSSSMPIQATSTTTSPMPIQATSTTTSPMPIQATSTTTSPIPIQATSTTTSPMPIQATSTTTSPIPIQATSTTTSPIPIQATSTTTSPIPIQATSTTTSPIPIQATSTTTSPIPIQATSTTTSPIPIQATSTTTSPIPIQATSTTTSPIPIQATSTTTAPMPILIASNTTSSMPIQMTSTTTSLMPQNQIFSNFSEPNQQQGVIVIQQPLVYNVPAVTFQPSTSTTTTTSGVFMVQNNPQGFLSVPEPFKQVPTTQSETNAPNIVNAPINAQPPTTVNKQLVQLQPKPKETIATPNPFILFKLNGKIYVPNVISNETRVASSTQTRNSLSNLESSSAGSTNANTSLKPKKYFLTIRKVIKKQNESSQQQGKETEINSARPQRESAQIAQDLRASEDIQ